MGASQTLGAGGCVFRRQGAADGGVFITAASRIPGNGGRIINRRNGQTNHLAGRMPIVISDGNGETKWFADRDGDGLGDSTTFIKSCDEPVASR